MRRGVRASSVRALVLLMCGIALGAGALRLWNPEVLSTWAARAGITTEALGSYHPASWQRPYGMAPQAFNAYLRACAEMNTSPARIGQTLGDHPRSVGYHRRDGFVRQGGQKIEYSAAVDLGVEDLSPQQRRRFLALLAKHGFASWYRSGPRWKNGEHVHAIYASLPMKPQLRGQVMEWLRDRRLAGQKPYAWERQLRRKWGLRR